MESIRDKKRKRKEKQTKRQKKKKKGEKKEKKGARASKWTNFIQSGGPPGTPQIMARGKIFSN